MCSGPGGQPAFLRRELPAVLHLKDQRAVFQGGADQQLAAAGQRRDAMFNAVLDQHLERASGTAIDRVAGSMAKRMRSRSFRSARIPERYSRSGLQFGIERHGVAGVTVQL